MKKDVILGFLIGFLLFIIPALIVWLLTRPAKVLPPVASCKHLNAECTINNSGHNCCPGLYCEPFNPRSGNGKCKAIIVTSTPTGTPTATPSPTKRPCKHTPTLTPTEEPKPTPTDEPSPEPTPEPTETPKEEITGIGGGNIPWSYKFELPVCNGVYAKPADAITGIRIDKDTVEFRWWPSTDPHDSQTIVYGKDPNNLEHSVTGLSSDTGAFQVNGLDAGHWWFKIITWRGECTSSSQITDP